MSRSPYDPKRITVDLYGHRRPVEGEIVALLHISFEDRGLRLIDSKSRSVLRDEIHELMITDEEGAEPGGEVNRVSAIAFFEITQGGLIVLGDEAAVGGHVIGHIAGYDMTHMPNHMNVLLKSGSIEEPTISVGEKIIFRNRI